MLSFIEAQESFLNIENYWIDREVNRLSREDYKRMQYFIFVKSVWDSYRAPVSDADTCVGVLQSVFSNLKKCRVCRPLGDFKDLNKMNHEDIYDLWVDNMNKLEEDSEGNMVSFFDVLIPHVQKLAFSLGKSNIKYEEYIFEGFAIMFYRASIGISLESRVIKELKNVYKNDKRVYVEAATPEMESDDIDAVVKRKSDDEVILNISIKCLGALTASSIATWRDVNGKNKTAPEVYIGFEKEDSIKFTTFWTEGMSKSVVESRKG